MANKTPILGLSEIVEKQGAPYLTHNEAIQGLELAGNAGQAVDCTAGGTITLATTTDFLAVGAWRLTGTPAAAFTFQVPDGSDADLVAAEADGRRIFGVINSAGQEATIDTPTGAASPVVIAAGEAAWILADGAGELYTIATSSAAAGSISVNPQTGTTYTLQSSDDQNAVTFNNAGAITVTLPNNLPAGFNCAAYQIGAGQVTFSAAAGATLQNRQSHAKTAGQWAGVGLMVHSNSDGSSAVYILTGDTAA